MAVIRYNKLFSGSKYVWVRVWLHLAVISVPPVQPVHPVYGIFVPEQPRESCLFRGQDDPPTPPPVMAELFQFLPPWLADAGDMKDRNMESSVKHESRFSTWLHWFHRGLNCATDCPKGLCFSPQHLVWFWVLLWITFEQKLINSTPAVVW